MQVSEYQSLVDTLAESFNRQNTLYERLEDLVQKILNQVVLRRGDLTGAMTLFAEKQRLVEAITTERERTHEEAERWQREKGDCPPPVRTEQLERVLARTQEAIARYLQGEEQLRRYLEHLMPRKEGGDSAQR
jgi:hypothetical protein